MIKTNKILMLLLLAKTAAFAQLNFSMESGTSYASNIFSNHTEKPDYISRFVLSINHDLLYKTNGWRLSYRGEMSQFNEVTDMSWQNHSIAANCYFDWNENRNRLNAGISASTRLHRDRYQWYEQWQGSGFLNTKWILTPHLFAYAGMNMRWREYPSLSPFSFHQETLFLRLSRFFDTGTTLIVESDLMGKSYIHNSTISTVPGLPEVITLGDGISMQWVGLARVAQALTRSTGFNMELALRYNPKTAIRYLGDYDGFYYSDEEVLDNIFGYHGEEFSTAIKQKLPWLMQLNLGSGLLLKRYDNRLAATLDGTLFPDRRLRQDERWLAWLNVQKSILLKSSWQPLTAYLSWTRINNKSNDPYYRYDSSYWSVGLSFGS